MIQFLFKYKLSQVYGISTVPKLLVLDIKTGEVLNNNLKLGIIGYIHEFCSRQLDALKSHENKKSASHHKDHSTDRNSSNININSGSGQNDEFKNYKNDVEDDCGNFNINFNFNFDFDMYDIYENSKSSRRHGSHHSKHSKHRSKSSHNNTSSSKKKKRLDHDLLTQLNDNLIDIITNQKYSVRETTSSDSTSYMNNYYLLYFCSNFTSNNCTNLFDHVIKFLKYMQEK